MSKRKSMDKAQARERRDKLLASAAAAELSLTEGVREMRAIAGMTQEDFARHRVVSARVIKAIELGQGNPTVATLNRIGQFFGLEVAFVPTRREPAGLAPDESTIPDEKNRSPVSQAHMVARVTDIRRNAQSRELADVTGIEALKESAQAQEDLLAKMQKLNQMLLRVDKRLAKFEHIRQVAEDTTSALTPVKVDEKHLSNELAASAPTAIKKRKPRGP